MAFGPATARPGDVTQALCEAKAESKSALRVSRGRWFAW